MNFRIIAKLLGMLLVTFSTSMTPSIAWSLWYGDGTWLPLLLAMLITAGAGAALFLWGRLVEQEVFRREATAVVGIGWILSACSGALPYYFAGLEEMPRFVDCYFESMSGLTTTGSSVLTDIEAVPRGLLFWRATTHWLGGLGIILLFIAVLPYLGAGGRALLKSEVTGPVKEGLTPKIKDTALLLYKVYIGYTIVETILLMMAGMTLFDALAHTFATLASGGFSTKNNSIAFFYENEAIEIIILVFMVLAGTNFALMYTVFTRKPLALLRDSEWLTFITVILSCAFFIAGYLLITDVYDRSDLALRDSLFTVVSLVTSTGFATADSDLWPAGAKWLLLVLMFIGGCAGSTSGGIKTLRFLILLKILFTAIERVYRPRTVRQIKVGSAAIPDSLQQQTLIMVVLWLAVTLVSTILLSLIEGGSVSIVTALSAVGACLNNVGPGFEMVGATQNFGFFSPAAKWLLTWVMVLGRLELYSIMVLFIPAFWRTR